MTIYIIMWTDGDIDILESIWDDEEKAKEAIREYAKSKDYLDESDYVIIPRKLNTLRHE